MNEIKISYELIDISKKYKVEVIRDEENCEFNHGGCAGRRIYLGKFDDPEIEKIAFFHELGHALSEDLIIKRHKVMTVISGECLAWEIGLNIAYENGFEWEEDSVPMIWAKKQLKTYFEHAYNFF